jgi:hypothetical protein
MTADSEVGVDLPSQIGQTYRRGTPTRIRVPPDQIRAYLISPPG